MLSSLVCSILLQLYLSLAIRFEMFYRSEFVAQLLSNKNVFKISCHRTCTSNKNTSCLQISSSLSCILLYSLLLAISIIQVQFHFSFKLIQKHFIWSKKNFGQNLHLCQLSAVTNTIRCIKKQFSLRLNLGVGLGHIYCHILEQALLK